MPEIVSISGDLHQHRQRHLYFILDLGSITKNLAVRAAHILQPEELWMYVCLLPGEKSLLVYFIPVLKSEAKSILPLTFHESHFK
jgi:hypothetical protein